MSFKKSSDGSSLTTRSAKRDSIGSSNKFRSSFIQKKGSLKDNSNDDSMLNFNQEQLITASMEQSILEWI
jgi:hypothetical protein